MPALIVAPASTSQSFPPPPPAALQPTLRILKRPSPNTSANNSGVVSSASPSSPSPGPTLGSGSGGTSPAPRGTLAEREALYQEARSRIFGEKEKSGGASGNASLGSISRTSSSSGGVVVMRDPLGPTCEPERELGVNRQDKAHSPDQPAKGFGERRSR
ncbi:hypothetical protein J3R83DRAFT_13621 [Lanmaoa asiatica]|nr:hypothetical protein J3R83DRAFT_13621 [Lanmaoa asiatica]